MLTILMRSSPIREALHLTGGPTSKRHTTYISRLLAYPHCSTSPLLSYLLYTADTVAMPDIEMPDPEELGGNVTKPFKFVTGTLVQPLATHFSSLVLS